jgi:YesN/AraC family two-component response regulator
MRILLIDDEEMIREVVRDMLETAGHEVIEAENGRHGLDQYRKHSIDVVITDILMPEKDGLETIQEVRVLDKDVRIIAMSGGGPSYNLDFLLIAKKLGATATLVKPFHQDALIACVTGDVPPSAPGTGRAN